MIAATELPRSKLRGIKQGCHARERGDDKFEASFGEFDPSRLKGKGVRSASKRLEPRGNKGAALKLRCQNADYMVNTGVV
jgi:hypothetical protein